MFETALFNDVVANFTSDIVGDTVPTYFVEAPESQNAPYIVMHVLDSNGDPQFLCDDFYDSADSFVQFNIYTESFKSCFTLKRELDLYLSGINSLTLDGTTYNIIRSIHGSSPNAQELNKGVAVCVLAKTFNYEKGA